MLYKHNSGMMQLVKVNQMYLKIMGRGSLLDMQYPSHGIALLSSAANKEVIHSQNNILYLFK